MKQAFFSVAALLTCTSFLGCGLPPRVQPQPAFQAETVPEPVLPKSPELMTAAGRITRITNDNFDKDVVTSLAIDAEVNRLIYAVESKTNEGKLQHHAFMVYLQRGGRVTLGQGFYYPAWLTGDDFIVSIDDEHWAIAKKNIGAPKTTFIAARPGAHLLAPAVSPDGNLIALMVEQDESYQVATVNMDGAEFTLYGEGNSPKWRFDGKTLVYVQQNQIYEMDLNKGMQTQLTFSATGMKHYSPEYSSNGEWIVFSAKKPGENQHIWIMRRDGSGRTQLTNGAGKEYAPVWSQNGDIYFVGETQSGSDIWRITPQL